MWHIHAKKNETVLWGNWGRRKTNPLVRSYSFSHRCLGWDCDLPYQRPKVLGLSSKSGCLYLHIYAAQRMLPFQQHLTHDLPPSSLALMPWLYGDAYGLACLSSWSLLITHAQISQSYLFPRITDKYIRHSV